MHREEYILRTRRSPRRQLLLRARLLQVLAFAQCTHNTLWGPLFLHRLLLMSANPTKLHEISAINSLARTQNFRLLQASLSLSDHYYTFLHLCIRSFTLPPYQILVFNPLFNFYVLLLDHRKKCSPFKSSIHFF